MTVRAAAVAWTVAIVAACLVPGDGLPTVQIVSFDKLVHVALFVGFGALWLVAFPGRLARVVVAGVALALAIEVVQGALPIQRAADPLDAVADVVGLAVGLGLGRWWTGRTRPT